MKIVPVLVLAFLYQFISAQEVAIPGTQTKRITSSIVVGQEYQLQIMLPRDYAKSEKLYPVVYLLDSQWDFPLVNALYGEQYYDGFVPPMIIVGVTWGGDNPDPERLRARDYTPTTLKGSPQTGGADKFLSFMRDELFPFVEKNYRTDKTDRTLVGCSLGGLLTMYSLFTQPEMFQRYIAASPASNWDNDVLYRFEKSYAELPSRRPAKLFLCVGGVEVTVPGFQKLTASLQGRHYPSLQMESRVLENTGHSGTKGEGYARGLQFIFKRPSVSVSHAVLDRYTGKYQLPDGTVSELKRENDRLVFPTGDGTTVPLFSASEREFYSNAFFLTIRFQGESEKRVAAAEVETYSGTVIAKKL